MKRPLLENLQRRKDEKESPCDDCNATARNGDLVCSTCLGQTVLLTRLERDYLLEIAGCVPSEMDDDSFLHNIICQHCCFDGRQSSIHQTVVSDCQPGRWLPIECDTVHLVM